MNTPVTRKEMEAFKQNKEATRIGGKTFTGFDEKDNATFYPNHAERRKLSKLKRNNQTLKNNRKTTKARLTTKLEDVTVLSNNVIVRKVKSFFKTLKKPYELK